MRESGEEEGTLALDARDGLEMDLTQFLLERAEVPHAADPPGRLRRRLALVARLVPH